MAITDTSIYQDKIMGGVEGDPLTNISNQFARSGAGIDQGFINQYNFGQRYDPMFDNEEFEEIAGFNFKDAPIETSFYKRMTDPAFQPYRNNPRTGFIDSKILSKGNPDNSLINRTTNAFGNFTNTIGGGLKSILDNTIIGRIGAGFDATNPRAFNYNPALQGQIDFMKSQGMYGTNPTSGLNQITSGVLAGKNLQSGFGSNDLTTMYEKELARATGVLEGLPDQWSKLKEDDPEEYQKKVDFHRNKVAKIKQEQAAAAAAAQAAADERIAAERAAGAAANVQTQRGGGAGDSSTSHMGGISQAQADAVGAANKAAGMGGWGLADGGRVYLNLGGIARLL